MNGGMTGRTRSGFTLVELLVVIVILSVLTALITAAAAGAFTMAKEVATKLEVDHLDTALKNYKNNYGEFPPSDFSDTDRIRRHLKKRFPRANFSNYSVPALTQAQALVFWLRGFYQNPVDPLKPFNTSDRSEGREPLFDFDSARLIDPGTGSAHNPALSSTVPYYVPEHGVGKPYLYFEASTYKTGVYATSDGTNVNILQTKPPIGKRPYMADELGIEYVNSNSFQIISGGLDGNYGRIPDEDDIKQISFPSGLNYSDGDWDNITNFGKRNLKVSQP